jgi:steroid 5-alpha reductase family enzyme
LTLIYAWCWAGLALSLIMAGAWLAQRRSGNAGWIDVIWSAGTGLVGSLLALAPIASVSPAVPEPSWRQILVAAAIAAWSLRLASHIGGRSHGQQDDPRYAQLQLDWGTAFPWRLFLFLQVQAAAAWLLVVAVSVAAHNPAPGLGAADLLGGVLVIAGLGGEAQADRQLRHFRRTTPAPGICERGLWRWSRHPNYFFEWLGWCAYPCFALSSSGAGIWPWGLLAVAAPAFMYWLLVHVSGIPPLEAHMLRSRGAAYARYQQNVSAFFPRPTKASSSRSPT